MGFFLRCGSCGGFNRVKADKVDRSPTCGRCHTALDTSGHPIEVDDDLLARIVASSPVPVVVDFWAPWCAPCRMVAPHLEQLGKDHLGRLLVVKVNTDEHQRTAAALGVRGIPTLAIYKGGKLQKSQAGAMMGAQLQAYVAPYLD